MKKIMITIFLTFAVMTYSGVAKGQTYPNDLPGGKNYIDPLNVTISSNSLSLSESIKVLPNTTYTLTFPGEDPLNRSEYVGISGVLDYLDDSPFNIDSCILNSEFVSCTFTTAINESLISIFIQVPDMERYYNLHGTENFQLEVGEVGTAYEPYVVPLIDSTNPIFSGSGGFITSYQEATPLYDIIGSHIFAYDEIDGDLTNKIIIESDEYTNNEQILGQYSCLLSVEDLSGNKTYFNLIIMVKDEIAPYFEGSSSIYVDVENQMALSEIISDYVIFKDDYDLFPNYTVLSETYTGNMEFVGTYSFEMKIEDDSGNFATRQYIVYVEDRTSPIITSSLEIVQNVDYADNIGNILGDLVIIDNYDFLPSVSIVDDDYTLNKSSVGLYFVQVIVSDFSGNTTEYTIQISVIDNGTPVINGPDTIQFSYEINYTLEQIIEMFSVSDNYDSLTNENLVIINDTYTNRSSTIGSYFIEFELVDNSGNVTTKIIQLIVVDDISPIIFVDEYIVVVESGSSFSKYDAYKLLVSNFELDEREYDIEVLIDEYTENSSVEGLYNYQVKFTDDEGYSYTKDFIIEVTNPVENDTNYVRVIASTGTIVGFTIFVFIKKRK